MATLAQDTLLGDRYRLSRRIAVGGMGEVWRAEDSVLHRTVAVKVLKSELTSDPRFLERFRAEARTTAALSHPGIANVFDYGEAVLDGSGGPETAYLVMEFVDGEPLSAALARTGRLPVPRTLEIVGQAATALDVAHRAGMVHRDIKPGNLLVRPDGVVKITDFGIARAADAVPLTQSGMVVGTAQYFSPEQAEGRVVSAPSDVYSLGVVAYECLAGRLPFVADSAVAVAMMQIREAPPPLPAGVPVPVRALVARAMAKDPRARFGTAGELAAAVHAVRQGRYDAPGPLAAAAPDAPAPQPGPFAPPGQPRSVGALGPPGPAAPFGPAGPAGPAGQLGTPGAPGRADPSRTGSPSSSPGHRAPPRPAGPVRPPAGPAGPTGAAPPPGPTGAAPPPGFSGTVPLGPAPAGGTVGAPVPGPAAPRRTARWPLLLAATLVVALIAGGGIFVLLYQHTGAGSGTGPGTGTSSAPSTARSNAPTAGSAGPGSTAPASGAITLDKNDYIGGDLNEVADRLRALQLVPVLREAAPTRLGRPGEVVDLVWQGELRPGSEIIVIAIPTRGRGKNR